MLDRLLGIFGWRLLLITGDPCVLDRWLWLRGRLRPGRLRTFDAGSGNGGFSIYDPVANPENAQSRRDMVHRRHVGGHRIGPPDACSGYPQTATS